MFEIRKRSGGLCLIGKIVPEHCTTILKAALQEILGLRRTRNLRLEEDSYQLLKF